MDKVVIISAVQQSDSVIRVHILILLQIFSHVDYHRVSNDFLRLFHTCKYMHWMCCTMPRFISIWDVHINHTACAWMLILNSRWQNSQQNKKKKMFFVNGWGSFTIFTFKYRSYHEDPPHKGATCGVTPGASPGERGSCLPVRIPTLGHFPTTATGSKEALGGGPPRHSPCLLQKGLFFVLQFVLAPQSLAEPHGVTSNSCVN